LKAQAESQRENVRFGTNVSVALLSVNSTLEKAYGDANKTIFEAKAVAATIGEVV